MNCSICYENFVNPEDFEPEEFRKMIKENHVKISDVIQKVYMIIKNRTLFKI